jgi:Domain of unknown function (DUF932)
MTTALAAPTNAFQLVGTEVPEARTALEALEMAGLTNLNLTKVPLFNTNGRPAAGKYGLETGNGELLPGVVVGEDYEVVPYEAYASMLDAVAERTGATIDSVGALGYNSTRAFISLKLPQQLLIGADDPVDGYIAAFLGHGTTANHLMPTGIRIFCANQQPQLTRDNKYKIVIRHTSSASERTAKAEETLVASVAAMNEMATDARAMRAAAFTPDQLHRAIDLVYPLGGDSKAAQTRYDRRVEAITGIHNGDTMANIRNTAWGAYQALIEFDQWHRSVRNPDDDSNIERLRARRSLASNSSAFVSQLRAFDVVRALAGLSDN